MNRGSLLLLAGILAGCSSSITDDATRQDPLPEPAPTTTPTQRPEPTPPDPPSGPATPADLARTSAANYDDNEAGLITASRLEAWLTDWQNRKPAGVRGDLIILQLDAAEGERPYVTAAPGVRVHLAAELTRLLEPRNNGIAAIGTVPSNGIRIDSFMRRFDIHPNRDLVLLVAGTSSDAALADLTRAWLSFRYWGFEHESLAVLNGGVGRVLDAERRSAEVAEHPFRGLVRISTQPQNHFALLADLGAVRQAIGDSPILDARPSAEYEGVELGASAIDTTCLDGAPSCTPTFSGRIRGARSLPWTSLLEGDGTFKSRDQLTQLVAATGVDASQTAYVYDLEGRGSALLSFALLGVVGQPARWYAASFLEWGALNASHPEPALRILREDSPWRTDLFPELSDGESSWATLPLGVRPLVFDGAASSAARVQESDEEYKRSPPALPAVGAGEDGC